MREEPKVINYILILTHGKNLYCFYINHFVNLWLKIRSETNNQHVSKSSLPHQNGYSGGEWETAHGTLFDF